MTKPPDGVEITRWWDERAHCWEFRSSVRIEGRFTVSGFKAAPGLIEYRAKAEEIVLGMVEHEARKVAAKIRGALDS